MRFTVEHIDKIVIFTLKNERLDGEVSAKFKAEILILCQPDIEALIIDLSNVESIDSAGLGALLLAHRQLKDHAIPVILVGIHAFVRTLMNISQLESLFEFYDTLDDALDAFKDGFEEGHNEMGS